MYFEPPPGSPLARFGQEWFGMDTAAGWTGKAPTPYVETPRKYGFHATLKAPMRLREDCTFADFNNSVQALSEKLKPVPLGILKPRRIGRFLALTVEPELHDDISKTAWSCVRELDRFRAPLTQAERDKRGMLAPELMQNMEAWGYPYVGDAFRFHMTLTSQLADSRLEDALGTITGLLPSKPVMLDAISVYADPGGVRPFERVERHVLKA